jgi:hypothetical protein
MQHGQHQSRLASPQNAKHKVTACSLDTQAGQNLTPLFEYTLAQRKIRQTAASSIKQP